jgi:peptide-methionine (R)-S-oxide reductase
MTERVEKSDEEWRRLLSEAQYAVCRAKGTEPPFSGEYNDCKAAGTYRCVCCGNPLFRSEAKFDSGTGWPSFFEPIAEDAVRLASDTSMFMRRVEVVCAGCDAHLGHLFPDGPPPTGKRYCMNSVSLTLARAGEG